MPGLIIKRRTAQLAGDTADLGSGVREVLDSEQDWMRMDDEGNWLSYVYAGKDALIFPLKPGHPWPALWATLRLEPTGDGLALHMELRLMAWSIVSAMAGALLMLGMPLVLLAEVIVNRHKNTAFHNLVGALKGGVAGAFLFVLLSVMTFRGLREVRRHGVFFERLAEQAQIRALIPHWNPQAEGTRTPQGGR